jgi:AcrR family transcriptional regulator
MSDDTPQRTQRARSRGRGRPRDPAVDARILGAARDLVAELGYQQVTMERIAERAGVAKTSLYRRWPTRAAVITDAVADDLAPAPVPDTGSLVDDALGYLGGMVHTLTLLGDPSVVAGALAERGEAGQAELAEILRAYVAPGEELLHRAIRREELPGDLPVPTVIESWAGYLLYRIVFLRTTPSDADLRELVALLPAVR